MDLRDPLVTLCDLQSERHLLKNAPDAGRAPGQGTCSVPTKKGRFPEVGWASRLSRAVSREEEADSGDPQPHPLASLRSPLGRGNGRVAGRCRLGP